MKGLMWTMVALVAATLLVAGCGQREPTEAPQIIKEEVKELPKEAPTAPPMAAPKMPPAEMEKPAEWAEEATGEYADVLNAFRTADPDTRSAIERATSAMKEGNYAEALPILQQQLMEGKLSPEQQKMLKDLIAQAQKHMAERAVEQALPEAEKMLPELKKPLPFGE